MGVGFGNLEKDKKYVVLIEFYGPAPLSDTRKLKKSLMLLLTRYKGNLMENVSATKRRFDPKRGWVKGFNPPDAGALVHASAKKARRRKRSR